MHTNFPERVEISREKHVSALREGRHRLYQFMAPLGGLTIVHNVIVIAVPEEADAAISAYSILKSRLETNALPDLREGMSRRQKLDLSWMRSRTEFRDMESLAIWDHSMAVINHPVTTEEVQNLNEQLLD